MKLVADLHIHSHFSRATSANLTFEQLARWAQLKGIHVVGTGDIAHPGWLAEMRDRLVPAEEGLFRLRDDLAVEADVPPACRGPVRFIIGGEISNIYKRADRTRKVHNIVFAPSFEAVERLQARLERIGNIRADGRPILGLDSRDLLEIVLETDPACHLIPAHIWTPWFSLLGSKSGFDSVEACYADLTPHITALETGLSSDPPMNWRVSALDRYTLVSNSDAHSPEKLGREANLFDCELAYSALFDALRPAPAREKGREGGKLLATIEFFPEEGKYHLDGHRACDVVWEPAATRAHDGICPVCGKPVTVGVMHRVEALADRPAGVRPAHAAPFVSLIPLPEVLGEVHGVGAGSKRVGAEYMKLLARLGPELTILRETPLEEIAAAGGERLAEAIDRMRRGEVAAQPGYDGEYGVIRVFGGASVSETQMGLFGAGEQRGGGAGERRRRGAEEKRSGEAGEKGSVVQPPALFAVAETPAPYPADGEPSTPDARRPAPNPRDLLASLNPEQRAAALYTDAPLAIIAGPGTGKTRTLSARIAHLIRAMGVPPEEVLAITFTNKAAGEMRERLEGMLGEDVAGRVTIKTFHAFGALLLRQHAGRLGLSPQFVILSEEDRLTLLRRACPELKAAEAEAALADISAAKNSGIEPSGGFSVTTTRPAEASTPASAPAVGIEPSGGFSVTMTRPAEASTPVNELYLRYGAALRASDAVDFDDLILLPIRLLEEYPDVLATVQARYRWISVDEYQDVNAAQYRLLRLLTGGGANLCVIGDPDQAIYGFRGADPRYFLRFEQDYPGARVLNLSRNYRSSRAILDAATQVIARNPDRKAVELLAEFADEVKLDIYRAATDKAEAEYVVHQIEQMVGGTSYFSLDSGRTDGFTPAVARSFADFAVLYRLSAQSRLLIEAFDRSGIPYQTVGQAPLTNHKAVREVLAHLWRLYNPRAPLFGPQCAGLRDNSTPRTGNEASAGLSGSRGQPAEASIPDSDEPSEPADQPVARLIEQIVERLAAQRKTPLGDADVERLAQLALRAVPYGNRLADFLEAIALQSETDAYDPRADRVTLMSLHASKGLEFPVVFIIGCEEGLLPYERKDEVADIEEERRLFYVGLTRAGRKLVLTHAARRVLFGQFMENAASRFVGDIETALKELRVMQYKPPERKPESGQLSLF